MIKRLCTALRAFWHTLSAPPPPLNDADAWCGSGVRAYDHVPEEYRADLSESLAIEKAPVDDTVVPSEPFSPLVSVVSQERAGTSVPEQVSMSERLHTAQNGSLEDRLKFHVEMPEPAPYREPDVTDFLSAVSAQPRETCKRALEEAGGDPEVALIIVGDHAPIGYVPPEQH